ncbi:3-hydroxyacyl-CoA dehydrogenase type-2-like [Saccostrea echinata]|uniref:3-hydroxyacyl-CoA dehydrogenase type-2-like n=1 Tax=Saccostrea echinata TaxID=191078 RepID=UPI002A8029CE|nr:3-hydroxyacyl-CoA dehydrogenase type-2-like [Saccostrea echinata]
MASVVSKFKGTVFLIANGSRNLGRICAENFVQRGGRVVLCDTDTEAGEEIQESLGRNNCLFFTADLTKEEDVEKAINLTEEKFGKLDVTINCPSYARTSKIHIKSQIERENSHENTQTETRGEKLTEEFMEKLLRENLTSTFNVCRLSAGLMSKNEPDSNGQRGVIINKSHTLGFGSSLVPYTMSQAAIIGMTLPMARDFNDLGIRVNSIATGFLDYQIPEGWPKKRERKFCSLMAFPHKLGSSQTFYHLCEKIIDNPYVNGEVIKLDAGVQAVIL